MSSEEHPNFLLSHSNLKSVLFSKDVAREDLINHIQKIKLSC